MSAKGRQCFLVLPFLGMLACSDMAQAFSFCFSFGSNNRHRGTPYDLYPIAYPPPYTLQYPGDGHYPPPPGMAYSPIYPYPSQQSYGVPVPSPVDGE